MLGQTPVVGPNPGPVDTPSTAAKAEIPTLPAAATAPVPPVDSSAPAAAVPSNILDAVAEVLDQADPAKAASVPAARPQSVPKVHGKSSSVGADRRTEPTTMLGTDLQLRQKTSSSDHQVDGFSLLGVRLSYFDTFIDEWCGGREKIDGWKTEDVCAEVVKPRTTKSVCDHLVEENSSAVGRATWFISHAWQYNFLDVVDAVKYHFTTRMSSSAAKPFTFWTGTFTNAISNLGSVLMILYPWNNPITLERAWCIFELYACTNTNSHFAIALPPRHTSDFRTSLRDNPGAFYNMLATVKSEKSVAFKESDQLDILAAIRKMVGFSALDRMVLSLLSKWMVNTLHSHILLTEKAGDEVEHAGWLFSLARLFVDQGRYEDAEPLLTEELLGEEHPDTLDSISSLAAVYSRQGNDEKAEPLFVDCLERRRRVLGEDHEDTLMSISNLAMVYSNQGKYGKAEPMLLDCLERRRRVLGEDDLDTLWSINSLAGFYDDRGKYEKAEPLYVDCLERLRRVLGEDHPDALVSILGLAILYEHQGKYEKAEPLYVDCLERRRRMLGEDHLDTLVSINRLAGLYRCQGKYEKAEPLYVDCLERSRRVHGDHPKTFIFIHNLARLYKCQGKYEEAEPLYVDCLERRRRVLGEDHPKTQKSRKKLSSLRRRMDRRK
ncbi:Kinesin light chain 3 [Borealophlyctis nickersoniae]|nr:Kinesin light chain 3 [Borealophlyctis nickersoniae]